MNEIHALRHDTIGGTNSPRTGDSGWGAWLLALTLLLGGVSPVSAVSYTVTNANDSGPGSLRQAIADSAADDTIVFDGDHTITLSSPLEVATSLTIDGRGHTVTLSGNDTVRVLDVLAGVVTLESLTITNGKAPIPDDGSSPTGGGVLIESGAEVTLSNSAVLSNIATLYDADWNDYYGSGGGIYNRGTLTVVDSTFSDNVASSRTGYANGTGGAIYNRGTLVVTGSTFTSNAAGMGGAIYNRSGSTLTVASSTASTNSAPCGGAGIGNRGTATVSDSTISDNVAPGDWCEGGAAGLNNDAGTMTVSRSTISGNTNESSDGGGLSSFGYSPDLGQLTVIDCTVVNNTSGGSGGGIYSWWDSVLTVTGSTIAGNTAGWYGGGILSGPHANTTLTLTNTTVSGNSAQDGGGLFNGSPGYSGSKLTMTHATVVGNIATVSGGGLYNLDSADVTLDNSILWGNSAPTGPQAHNTSTNRPTIRSSDIEGSGGSGAGWDAGLGTDGGGNLDQDPVLGSLADHGGPTSTHALQLGSPVIDAADGTACLATDQRGVGRPQGGGCDIGAFESQGVTLGDLTGTPQSAVIGTAFAAPLGLTVTANDPGVPVTGVVVSFTAPASGASAVLGGSPVTVGADGAASVTAAANGVAGSYTVTAGASGATSSVGFSLTNLAVFIVTPSAGANGSIAPDTPQTVVEGQTAQFTVTANEGYTASVGGTCGGALVGDTYTTDAITASCTVEATFTLKTYPVSGTVTDGVTGLAGATVNFSHDGHTETTAADGTFSHTVPHGTTTTLTPSLAGYGRWSPASRTLSALAGEQTGLDFEGVLLAANDTSLGAEAAPELFALDGDGTWMGTTLTGTDGYSAPNVGTCLAPTDGVGADLVYFFDVVNGSGAITLTAHPTDSWDPVLLVLDALGVPLDCSNAAGLAGDEALSLSGLANGRYFVVVDGSAGSEGPFELVVTEASVPVTLMHFAIDGDLE